MQVRRLGLYPGCRVKVKRAGDVIPRVVGLASTTRPKDEPFYYELPKHCPVCGSVTARDTLISKSIRKKLMNSNRTTDTIITEDDTNLESIGVRCTGGFSCSAQAIEQIS